jgi:RNA polymerase sigma-70 factor (ECF subfamily)
LQDADARDVTQNVLLKLAEKLRTFHYDSGGSFRAWLKTLTRHAWSDYVDSQRRGGRGSGDSAVEELLQNVSSGDELAEQLREPFDFELFDEACSRVQDRVDVQSWEAFRLAGLEDLAAATVAEQLDMSVAAVYKAKSRVLKHLQEEIRRLEGDEMP